MLTCHRTCYERKGENNDKTCKNKNKLEYRMIWRPRIIYMRAIKTKMCHDILSPSLSLLSFAVNFKYTTYAYIHHHIQHTASNKHVYHLESIMYYPVRMKLFIYFKYWEVEITSRQDDD